MTDRIARMLLLFVAACGSAPSHRTAASMPASMPAEPPTSAHQAPMTPAPASPATGYADVNTDNSLNSNGSVAATSENLLSTASGFRREVYRLGGRVYAEQVHYRAQLDDEPREASA